jgi:chromosomal replication initiation ATPase DnaA
LAAQLVLPLQLRPALSRDDFIVVPANEAAVAFVDAWPNWPMPAAALVGPSGSGKSHLAAVWREKSGAARIAADAKDYPVGQGPLLIEDIDRFPLGEMRDRLLFAALESGRPLLLSSQTLPSEWPALLPDLKSRFAALVAFSLWEPDDALLAGLARKLFADRQIEVSDTVINAMVAGLERMPAAIRDFVTRIDELALSRHKPISAGFVKEILSADGLLPK